MTTRAGSALVVYPEQPKHERPYFVAKHWWITILNGLCDLSLNLEGVSKHKPVIFRNANLADPNWKIVFDDDFKRIFDRSLKCRAAGMCGVLYQTDAKQIVAKETCDLDLLKVFRPAGKNGVALRYLDVVLHCERFLDGGESVLRLPQKEAWRNLAGHQSI